MNTRTVRRSGGPSFHAAPRLSHALLLAAALALGGCFDLDTLVRPVVFANTPMGPDEEYLLGQAESADFGEEINALYPDSSIDQITPVSFDSEGYTIRGFHLVHSALGASGTTMLYCEGNYRNLDLYWTRAKLLYHAGVNVLIFDYRGFGKSEGDTSEAGMYEDARNAVDWLLNVAGVAAGDISLYGLSLGSAPATFVAATHPERASFGKLVLEAPFGSAEMFVQDTSLLPLPGQFFTALGLDNAERIKSVSADLLWIHGTEDDHFIGYDSHGLAVFRNHPGVEDGDPLTVPLVKYRKIVDGGHHPDLPELIGFAEYVAGIRDFLEDRVPFAQE